MKLYVLLIITIFTTRNNHASEEQAIKIEIEPQKVTNNNTIKEDDQEPLLPKASETKLKGLNTQIPTCCACCLLCYSCIAATILSACDTTKKRES